MNKKLKTAVLVGTMLAGLSFMIPVSAESIALSELYNYSLENIKPSEKVKAIDKNHWAYKTLQNISENYGLLIGEPEKKFDTKAPLSRNEAAIILVNLVGQIEKKNLKLSAAEKARIEILEQEFMSEINRLEADIAVLKGKVAKLEDRNKTLIGTAYGEDFKITGGVRALFNGNINSGTPMTDSSNFSLPYSEVRLTGKLAEHVSYRALAVPGRNFTSSANGILDDLYVSTDIIPNHEVQLGQIWLPFGLEAPMYNLDIDFINYSQISRNLGQGLDTGTQIIGDWGFVNYTAGVYNGVGQNATDNNHGLGYASQLNLKPFHNHPEFGDLMIGGSHLVSENSTNHLDGIGGHVSYDIGKFGMNFEYLNLDGLDTTALNKGEGFYADLMYRFNDKLTLLTRYDQFNPTIGVGSDRRNEYVLGANYMLTDNVMLMVNYTYAARQLATESDSSRLGLMTQVLF